MHNVRQPAALHLARTFVSKIGALDCMAIRACVALFAVTQTCKSFAHWSINTDTHMSISTIVFGAVAVLKVNACR
jgi:hypothetical protein